MSLTELHLLDGEPVTTEDPDRVAAWPARLLLFLLLAGAVLVGLRSFTPPLPLGGLAPASEFAAQRAMSHVEAIAKAPPAGVESYLAGQLTALGLSVETVEMPGRNVMARLRGTAPSGAIVLAATYDPLGAASRAAGAATILETLRAVSAGPKPKNDVIVLLSEAAEIPEAAFRLPGAAIVLTLERLGDRGPVALLSTSRENGWLVREALRELPHPTVFFAPRGVAPRSAPEGAAAWLSFVAIGGPATGTVTPDRATIQDAGATLLALVGRFGSLPLPGPKEADLVTFSVGRDQIVSHPASWSRTLGALSLALAVALAGLGFVRKKLSLQSLATGLVLVPAAVVAAAGAGSGLLALLVRSNPGGFLLPWGTAHAAWFSGAVLAFTVAVVAALDVLLRAWRKTPLSDAGLATAGLIWWSVAGLLTAFRDPASAHLFVAPSLLIVPAFLVLFLTEEAARHPWLQASALALPAVAAILVLTPIWRLVDIAAGWSFPAPQLSLAAVSAGLGAFVAALLLPHLSLPRRRWLFPLFCLVVTAGVVVAGARLTP